MSWGEGRERILSRVSVQHGAWREAWSHDPGVMMWAKVKIWTLNQLSHPGAPNTFKVLQFVVFRICLPLKLPNCMKLSLEDSARWLVPDCNWRMADLEKSCSDIKIGDMIISLLEMREAANLPQILQVLSEDAKTQSLISLVSFKWSLLELHFQMMARSAHCHFQI